MGTLLSAQNFLEQAKATMDERGKTYDSEEGERSAAKVANAFNAIKGQHIVSAADIWEIQILLKLVRQEISPTYHEDSALDAVAYTALMAEELAG